jgi:hypothetical protein
MPLPWRKSADALQTNADNYENNFLFRALEPAFSPPFQRIENPGRPQAKNKVEKNGVVQGFAQRRVLGPPSPQTDHENTTANHRDFQNTS